MYVAYICHMLEVAYSGCKHRQLVLECGITSFVII